MTCAASQKFSAVEIIIRRSPVQVRVPLPLNRFEAMRIFVYHVAGARRTTREQSDDNERAAAQRSAQEFGVRSTYIIYRDPGGEIDPPLVMSCAYRDSTAVPPCTTM
jgi:hypothetical protein